MVCPRVMVPVQFPIANEEASKLPAIIPVALDSWLAALEKFGKFCGGGFTPSNAVQRFVPELKFPDPSVRGFRIARFSVSPVAAVPKTNAVVLDVGITLPALQETVGLMSQRCRLSALADEDRQNIKVPRAAALRSLRIRPTFMAHLFRDSPIGASLMPKSLTNPLRPLKLPKPLI